MKYLRIKTLAASLTLILGISSLANAQENIWKIKKTSWSDIDEKEYSEFVGKIGEAVAKRECNSFQSCLNHPNNPFRGSDISRMKIFADCAKLSYVMRAYFAWKKGLPFSFVSDIELRNVVGNSGDKRYSKFGNVVTGRTDLIPRKRSSGEVRFFEAETAIAKTIVNGVYSANFRLNFEDLDNDKLFADFYPVKLGREAIIPGTNIYDPNGHVAIVYKVTDDGKIYFIDAHPDNSLTSGLYGTKFVRSNPGQGAGFKNFRPIRLEGAQYDSKLGSYIGGTIVPVKDADLSNHSLEQFFGTNLSKSDWKKGVFQIDGITYPYYDYLRMKLSKGNLKLDPVNEIKSLAEDLCQTVQDRVDAVDTSLKTGIQKKAHPEKLPTNIYGTSGEWEEYSTPSRDARLKTSFKELRDTAEHMVTLFNNRDPRLIYAGANLKKEMLESYLSVSRQCKIVYTKTNGEKKQLTLDQVRERLFNLSFDPYHCAELRWGAIDHQELSSCPDDSVKRQWFAAEKWLRFQIERRYDARMDFSLSELLTGPKPNVGVAAPPDVDVAKYLSQ